MIEVSCAKFDVMVCRLTGKDNGMFAAVYTAGRV